jgi:tungstate transport system substrate-binding protein
MMKQNRFFVASIIALLFILLTACSGTSDNSADKEKKDSADKTTEVQDLILATTTSTQDSGLLDGLIIPLFEEKYPEYKIKTIAVGTGEALKMGEDGEADVLLTHAPAAEQVLVDNGDVQNYKRVMYNDFIIVGPNADAAGIKGLEVEKAFQTIADKKGTFISRGDDSGTNKKELEFWKSLNITPDTNKDEWYIETGSGMGDTLRVAAEKQGYVLTDRATWLAQKKNYPDMDILVEHDESLKNIYHVMEVNPDKNDQINNKGAKAFVEFMVDDEVQNKIEEFGKKEYGQSLFFKYTE